MDPRFAHIRDWIFDLDNCLYPGSTGLFELIDERMGAYIERLLGVDAVEARRVQKMHFHGSGTTLAGLMKHHDVDPHHFMGDVHDIPLDRVARDDRLVARSAAAAGPQVHPHQRRCRLCLERARRDSASRPSSTICTTSSPPT